MRRRDFLRRLGEGAGWLVLAPHVKLPAVPAPAEILIDAPIAAAPIVTADSASLLNAHAECIRSHKNFDSSFCSIWENDEGAPEAERITLIDAELERLFESEVQRQKIQGGIAQIQDSIPFNELIELEKERQVALLQFVAKALVENETIDRAKLAESTYVPVDDLDLIANGEFPNNLMYDGKLDFALIEWRRRALQNQIPYGDESWNSYRAIKDAFKNRRNAILAKNGISGLSDSNYALLFRQPIMDGDTDYMNWLVVAQEYLRDFAEESPAIHAHILETVKRLYTKHPTLNEQNFPILERVRTITSNESPSLAEQVTTHASRMFASPEASAPKEIPLEAAASPPQQPVGEEEPAAQTALPDAKRDGIDVLLVVKHSVSIPLEVGRKDGHLRGGMASRFTRITQRTTEASDGPVR